MTYRVVAECAYATMDGQQGRQKVLLHRGAVMPDGTPEVEHLLSMKMIEKLGGDDDAGAGVNALGTVGAAESVQGPGGGSVVSSAPVGGDGPSDEERDAAAEKTRQDAAEAKRAAARAKLPADGVAPHHNAGKDVWVEYAVRRGMGREAAEAATPVELRQTLAAQQ